MAAGGRRRARGRPAGQGACAAGPRRRGQCGPAGLAVGWRGPGAPAGELRAPRRALLGSAIPPTPPAAHALCGAPRGVPAAPAPPRLPAGKVAPGPRRRRPPGVGGRPRPVGPTARAFVWAPRARPPWAAETGRGASRGRRGPSGTRREQPSASAAAAAAGRASTSPASGERPGGRILRVKQSSGCVYREDLSPPTPGFVLGTPGKKVEGLLPLTPALRVK